MQTIIVTGGSGYVAEWVISELLNHGYRVRASLRSLTKAPRVRPAVNRQVSNALMGQLSFFNADLISAAGWAEGMPLCTSLHPLVMVPNRRPNSSGLPRVGR